MTLTHKALWVIERNLNRPLTLAEIAESCGVSRYHLAHAFGESAGRSVMHYVRGRRLSAAARALANGAPDILDLALETGYESHEAFSRAFRAQFGATPEMVRRKANTEDLPMVEALNIPPDESVSLAAPTYIAGAPMLFVGLARRHAFESPQGIPAQWREFMAHYDEIPNKKRHIPDGVTADMDEDGNFDYVCAVEVTAFSDTPRGLIEISIPAQNYAVFLHEDHVSKIGATYSAILNRWLPENNRIAADAPTLERHRQTFDPSTGLGGVEIWMPLKVT